MHWNTTKESADEFESHHLKIICSILICVNWEILYLNWILHLGKITCMNPWFWLNLYSPFHQGTQLWNPSLRIINRALKLWFCRTPSLFHSCSIKCLLAKVQRKSSLSILIFGFFTCLMIIVSLPSIIAFKI